MVGRKQPKIGQSSTCFYQKDHQLTVVLVIDTAGKVQEPQIWRGIGQGYDEYAWQLMQSNPHPWLPGQDAQGKPVATELYYQIDFVKNKNRVVNEANEAVD